MNKFNIAILALVSLASCLSNPVNHLTSASALAQTNNSRLQRLNLSLENTKLTLLAPKGSKIIESPLAWGTIEIKSGNGKNFHLELQITTNQNIITEVKKFIQDNDVNILKRFLIDSPDSLLYESSPGMNILEYNLYTYKNLGNIAITCENAKGNLFSESEARLMLESCRSITSQP